MRVEVCQDRIMISPPWPYPITRADHQARPSTLPNHSHQAVWGVLPAPTGGVRWLACNRGEMRSMIMIAMGHIPGQGRGGAGRVGVTSGARAAGYCSVWLWLGHTQGGHGGVACTGRGGGSGDRMTQSLLGVTEPQPEP